MIGSVIIVCGFSYAIACRMATGTTDFSIKKGRNLAVVLLALGLALEYIKGIN